MKTNKYCTSACRYCQFYNPEGRRGGMCSQLGVLVQGEWKSCHLTTPVFNTEWKTIPEIALLEKSFSLGCATVQGTLEVESILNTNQETRVSSELPISKSV
ncbi:hypothetical protein [Geminocystis sp. NIES-3709]|uniref:hypothetical protein n=1 Tax=Geminocystis sp. NIES-3709 TaxID=1617448 RepID=UPI0005FC8336|nr:hypothetical protein [Geminocystis sp. NIES-3709]BAQ64089.1 hypothetical protein GM3709_854 [Geminocystis sp. NIES-3709]